MSGTSFSNLNGDLKERKPNGETNVTEQKNMLITAYSKEIRSPYYGHPLKETPKQISKNS